MSEAFASAATRARVRSDGRWQGSITSRALPDSRDEVEELAPEVRIRMATIWLSQAATEARVATSFEHIHESLVALEADRGLVALAARAVDDEHRHAALCEDMAGRYAGRIIGPHPVLPSAGPQHPEATSETQRRALWVVGQCALNETFASAYLLAAWGGATSPLARAALRELLEDEVDHARVGWAFLASAPDALKEEVADWLLPLTVCNLREWRRLDLPDDDALAALGVPERGVAHEALTDALSSVLVPGFAHVGLDTRALERWVAQGAPVDPR